MNAPVCRGGDCTGWPVHRKDCPAHPEFKSVEQRTSFLGNPMEVVHFQPGDVAVLHQAKARLAYLDKVIGYVHKDWEPKQGQGRIFGNCPGPDYVPVVVGVLRREDTT